MFGGSVRAWMTGRTPRDIDIAVDCNKEHLLEIVEGITDNIEENRFGGLKVKEPLTNLEYDLWPLSSTWNLIDAKVPFTFENLARYASFNVDCIVVICEPLSGVRIFDYGFVDAMVKGAVEVNYEPNPIAPFNALRGLKIAAQYNLKAGQSLKDYVAKYLPEGPKRDVVARKYSEKYDNIEELWRLLKL